MIQMSEFLDMIANGDLDFDAQISSDSGATAETNELLEKISDSINSVRNSLIILEDESVKLSEAALSEDLILVAMILNLMVFIQDIQGFNQTFDGIKNPLEAASEFIRKIGKWR